MKILIIEDERELSKSNCKYLSSEQFTTETAFNFDLVLEKFLYTITRVSYLTISEWILAPQPS